MVGLATTPATQVLEDDEIATEKEKVSFILLKYFILITVEITQ